MQSPLIRRCRDLLFTTAVLLTLSWSAYAVDGVKLISQAKALNGGVTRGDAPGFPVSINRAGSYRLTTNLLVPDANTTAVVINADNVTLDLNGFRISGPGGSGTGVGVEGFVFHATVKNGSVTGMGSHGISLLIGEQRVENVRVTGNGGSGIRVSGGHVSNSTVADNGGSGISCFGGAVLLGNQVEGNSSFGLQMGLFSGYGFNVLVDNNSGGEQVTGGIELHPNTCGAGLC